jgi:acetoin utilization deacetylase AcuC-like enzyme
MTTRSTGFTWDERFMWWDTGHAGGFLPAGGWIEPDERVHTPEYLDRVKALSDDRGGDAGELTPFGPGGYEIAALGAGSVIEAAEAVLNRQVQNAYTLNRPPGHHAEADLGRGFCMFSNIAVVAAHVRAVHGIERVAVVDWDVHHGNGTQKIFYDEPGVLTISLHQDSYYPHDSGAADERGAGAGLGYNLNFPLPPGTGVGGYDYAFDAAVIPALREYRPELIIVGPSGARCFTPRATEG